MLTLGSSSCLFRLSSLVPVPALHPSTGFLLLLLSLLSCSYLLHLFQILTVSLRLEAPPEPGQAGIWRDRYSYMFWNKV